MKKFLKILAILLGIIILCVSGLLIYVKAALPNVGPPPEIKVETSPERIKRGEYLANHVMLCTHCHSKRDETSWSGPVIPGTEGAGGEGFTADHGFPGNFYARNISSSHLKDWTDGEIFRAITAGVTKDNKPIFNIMPWENYGQVDPADIKDLIAYLRTLAPQSNEPPPSEAAFPVNFLINTFPKKGVGGKRPAPGVTAEYGQYMVMSSGCNICHTNADKGKIIGEPFAGGFKFALHDGTAYSANITPDKETGIGGWDENLFLAKFKRYADSSYRPEKLKPGEAQTSMPWTRYAGMDSTDLKAIFAYLKTVTPVKNQVIKWKPKG